MSEPIANAMHRLSKHRLRLRECVALVASLLLATAMAMAQDGAALSPLAAGSVAQGT